MDWEVHLVWLWLKLDCVCGCGLRWSVCVCVLCLSLLGFLNLGPGGSNPMAQV